MAGASKRQGESTALAAVAGVAMLAVGAASVVTAPPSASGSAPSYAAPFDVREAGSARPTPSAAAVGAPVQAGAVPAPVEKRAESPAPILGDVAGLDDGSVQAPAAANGGKMEFRALTSFDGTMQMTAGGVAPVQQAQAQQVAYQPPPERAPRPEIQWNRPLNWVATNDLGYTYSGQRIR